MSRFLRAFEPEVLCLQETKVPDELFPAKTFEKLGYEHQAISGQKGYHGVAVVSRIPLGDVRVRSRCRHLYVTLPGGIELHNIYAPAGGDVPDPKSNSKFADKLRFYRALARWFRRRNDSGRRSVLVGDLNIAPLPNDVWSHQQLKRVVTHTPVEIALLSRLASSLGWIDAVRHFVPETQKLYTWWSYRAADWKRVDKGRRLDHAWVTPALGERLRSAEVFKRARGWKLPSDHVPVIMDLE